MEIEFFFWRILFLSECLYVCSLGCAVLVVVYFGIVCIPVLFTMLTYQYILFYRQIQIPVRTETQQLATEMPLHMLPYSMVLCVRSVVVDC